MRVDHGERPQRPPERKDLSGEKSRAPDRNLDAIPTPGAERPGRGAVVVTIQHPTPSKIEADRTPSTWEGKQRMQNLSLTVLNCKHIYN
jgi:hypothetical protein